MIMRTFYSVQDAMDAYVFVIFMVIQLGFIVYVFFVVPETKNRTVEDITSKFRK